jgi:hypothetical protein
MTARIIQKKEVHPSSTPLASMQTADCLTQVGESIDIWL